MTDAKKRAVRHETTNKILDSRTDLSNSNVIMAGDKYRAEVFLSAFSTSLPIEMETESSNPNQSISYNKGVCAYEVIPDSEGTYTFKGNLKIKDPGADRYVKYPFATEYKVIKPFAIVESCDEFVLHKGKENKINVSVPGIALEDLYILVSNAKVSGEKGKYTLIPGNENKCLVSVFARMKSGSKLIDQVKVRVVDK